MISNSAFYLDERFSTPTAYIRNWRKKGKSWEEIEHCCNIGIDNFLAGLNDADINITEDEWLALVTVLKEIEFNTYVGYIGDPQVPIKPISTNENSAWQKYKKKLIDNKFSAVSIDNIERASQKIVSQLGDSTEQFQPVRGMVVGNVQSGKTANMAGLIAMAEDYGYNFFIILSGTIDNLRRQTQERMVADLNSANCNLNLVSLSQLSGHTESGSRLQNLRLDEGDNTRYLYVCLKNTSRLNDLLVWINECKAKKSKLKVLVLDDEADQAGVNTANMSKDLVSKINRQIKALVFGQNSHFEDSTPYKSMNYIGYTATPYANFLNEANDKSLYPCNFILTLNSPEEYMGPQQIFGLEDVSLGLPIINVINEQEIEVINEMDFTGDFVPKELIEAVHWFICTVACFRYWKIGKPVTMLIHTSQVIWKHDLMGRAIEQYFDILRENDYMSEIEKTYNQQKGKLTEERFREEMVDFPKDQEICEYPNFKELKPFIEKLIYCGIDNIKMDEDQKLTYGLGVHLCIDNCANNKVTENDSVLRLIYPDKEKDKDILSKSPAFIVVGGATLSRGLTLEGLTTSYFVRSTVLADSLMQMGRWFGFRRGYELLPRLWISERVNEQFKFLTLLDTDLREELHNMESLGFSPKDYGPRLDSFPGFKLLQATSKNKRQNAVEIENDFANKKGQTTKFFGDDDTIENNFNKAVDFVNNLGPVDRNKINELKNVFVNDNTYMWFDKPYEDVIELLTSLKYPQQGALINDRENTINWFKNQSENGYLTNFNVVLASNAEGGMPLSFSNGVTIKMPSRRKLKEPQNCDIDLKIISYPNDRLLDINMSNLTQDDITFIQTSKNLSNVGKRIKFGLSNTPLLILYFIDKDSGKDQNDTAERSALNLKQHLVGYYVYIPYGNNGQKKKNIECNHLTVKLDFLRSDVDDEDDEIRCD